MVTAHNQPAFEGEIEMNTAELTLKTPTLDELGGFTIYVDNHIDGRFTWSRFVPAGQHMFGADGAPDGARRVRIDGDEDCISGPIQVHNNRLVDPEAALTAIARVSLQGSRPWAVFLEDLIWDKRCQRFDTFIGS